MIAIFREFNSGYALTPQIVKNEDVTPKEFAVVSENLKLCQVLIQLQIGSETMLLKYIKNRTWQCLISDEGLPKRK